MTVRVLHVVATDKRRGAEIFAADLVRALAASDVEQSVAILRDGARHVDFSAPTHLLGDGAVGRHHVARRVQALRRIIRRWRPDLLQVHGGEALTVAALGVPPTPLVYRRIGLAHPSLLAGWRRHLYRRSMVRCARVVAVADAVRRETQMLFRVSPRKVMTIPNGVDPARLTVGRSREELLAEVGLPPDALVLISVCALTWEKDPMAHVRVGARVLADVPAAVHLLVGDGPMRQQLEREVHDRGLEHRMFLLGSRDDVPDLMAASNVLLFASRPDGMEGMPGAVIEAAMLGLPVVGFDVAGVGEIVDNDRTGMLVQWADEQGLSQAATRLMASEARRSAMGTTAKTESIARFHIEPIARRYASLYREVVGTIDRKAPMFGAASIRD
jgi:glycosyltransferase involved in cell wall biosynthesis